MNNLDALEPLIHKAYLLQDCTEQVFFSDAPSRTETGGVSRRRGVGRQMSW